MTGLSRRAPVLVGVGVQMQRFEDATEAKEPIALMIAAAQQAGLDANAAQALRLVDRIAVPRGRWRYGDPARLIARAIGADRATSVLADPGVLQQSLIGDACRRIAQGEEQVSLVVGGEAGYRLLRAKIADVPLVDTEDDAEPDVWLRPGQELRHEVELRSGLSMPIGLYAMVESAYGAARGLDRDERLDEIAALYARFSEIATENPDAWRRDALAPETIRTRSERNPMVAFPYSRLHCTSWSVDQAAALLLCSVEKAEELGIDRERWVFPLVSAESNAMLPVSARAELGAWPGMRIAGAAGLEHAGLAPEEIDLVELYSCFPIAVSLAADELGLSRDRDLTVTGGMPFAGGPYNNYVLQSTARTAQLLRQAAGRSALVTSVSGVLTKPGIGVWATSPGSKEFAHLDLSAEVAASTASREVRTEFEGHGEVAASTVLYERDGGRRGIVLLDVADGTRTMAVSDESRIVDGIEEGALNGATVEVADGAIAAVARGSVGQPTARTGGES